jgi:hypothetical protein
VFLTAGARENSPPSQAWEENKVLEGKLLEVGVDLGRWFIVKRAAPMECVSARCVHFVDLDWLNPITI